MKDLGRLKVEKIKYLSLARQAFKDRYLNAIIKIQRFYRRKRQKRIFTMIMNEA